MNRMPRDLGKVRAELLARQARPVKLRLVASMAHYETTGVKRDAMLARDYFKAVSELARDLARVSDVYYVSESNRLVRLSGDEIEAGTFENGGDILRLPSGTVYRGLSMRRIDAMDAIAALKIARAAVKASAAASPQPEEAPASASLPDEPR